ncbi:MAG: DUF1854 domain-containing protein [Planctomycetia bacterium]|nr:DUF1854 domain-containing protein [Planctomycetia bacterium]
MRLREIPEPVQRGLEKAGIEPGEVLLSTHSDVTIGGEYRRQWLVITHSRLLTLDVLNGTVVLLRDIPLAEVSEVRIAPQVGCGFLEVRAGEHFVEVIRYSNAQADKFERVRAKLKAFLDGGTIEITPDDEINLRQCPKCGFLRRRIKAPCPQCRGKQRIGTRLLALMWPYRYLAAVLFLLIIVMACLEFATPLLMKVLIDGALAGNWAAVPKWVAEFSGRDRFVLLNWLVLTLLVLAVARLLLGIASHVLRAYIAPRVTFDLRQRLFEKLERLSVSYHDSQSVGVLMSRVTNDTQQLHELVEQITEGFFYQILLLVGAGAIMFWMDAYLTTFVLMTVPPVVVGSYLFFRYVHPRWHRVFEERARLSGFLNSILSGIREVKAFAQQMREKLRFANRSGRLRGAQYAIGKSAAVFFPSIEFVAGLAMLVVWLLGGRRIIGDLTQEEWTIGKLVAFLAFLRMFLTPFRRLGRMSHWVTRFMAASQRMFEILDTPEEIESSPERVEGEALGGRVEFRNVTFGYSRHDPVLHNISFDIRPGEFIGIAGRSGSGKSTMINLLSRFYDTDAGQVLLDGKDIRDFPVEQIHRDIGLVLQQPFLFRGSIVENVVYGRPNAPADEILEAARAANAHDFIMQLPDGYDMRIGDRGKGLSGGEQQRVCIARAILYDPKILILDEASSNVDTESEQAIQEALIQVAKGRTTIVIAHRLSTLRNADRIFVVEDGRIAERGTHAELLETRGMYYRLVQMQTRLTKGTTVDGLAAALEAQTRADQQAAEAAEADEQEPAPRDHAYKPINFVEPEQLSLDLDENGQLGVSIDGGELYHGVRCYYAFPVSDPYHYVSFRHRPDNQPDREIGILRNMWSMSTRDRQLVLDALEKRYLVHKIQTINSLRERFGYLFFDVDTDRGRMEFCLPRRGRFIREYGENGKVILDITENRYIIPDLDKLSRRELAMFRQHVFW